MKPKILSVVGTNASGKSDLAVKLALHFNGEVISADSRQLYRGLDLGTGKLTIDEMQGVPHYMIDILDVNTMYSVVDYQREVYRIIDDILSRGKLPIIAGGTGLYTRAVVKGYIFRDVPQNDELRERLETKTTEELYEELKNISEAAAARNTASNRRRIIRALEKYYTIGEAGLEEGFEPRYEALQLGVTWPNEILHKRIDERMKRRFDQGMLEEVKELLRQGATGEFLEALGLEYRYIYRYISGDYKTKDELYEALGRAIKRFAKQQKTWFRKDQDIHWLAMDQQPFEEAVGLVENYLSES